MVRTATLRPDRRRAWIFLAIGMAINLVGIRGLGGDGNVPARCRHPARQQPVLHGDVSTRRRHRDDLFPAGCRRVVEASRCAAGWRRTFDRCCGRTLRARHPADLRSKPPGWSTLAQAFGLGFSVMFPAVLAGILYTHVVDWSKDRSLALLLLAGIVNIVGDLMWSVRTVPEQLDETVHFNLVYLLANALCFTAIALEAQRRVVPAQTRAPSYSMLPAVVVLGGAIGARPRHATRRSRAGAGAVADRRGGRDPARARMVSPGRSSGDFTSCGTPRSRPSKPNAAIGVRCLASCTRGSRGNSRACTLRSARQPVIPRGSDRPWIWRSNSWATPSIARATSRRASRRCTPRMGICSSRWRVSLRAPSMRPAIANSTARRCRWICRRRWPTAPGALSTTCCRRLGREPATRSVRLRVTVTNEQLRAGCRTRLRSRPARGLAHRRCNAGTGRLRGARRRPRRGAAFGRGLALSWTTTPVSGDTRGVTATPIAPRTTTQSPLPWWPAWVTAVYGLIVLLVGTMPALDAGLRLQLAFFSTPLPLAALIVCVLFVDRAYAHAAAASARVGRVCGLAGIEARRVAGGGLHGAAGRPSAAGRQPRALHRVHADRHAEPLLLLPRHWRITRAPGRAARRRSAHAGRRRGDLRAGDRPRTRAARGAWACR